MQKKIFTTTFGGRELIAEFNDLAENAHGSVLLRYGDTIILATTVMNKERKVGMDFFPLSVEYEERFYASGQILGSRFMRREGRPSDDAILSGRITDRTIRPLFDQRMRNEVQVILTVLSLGEEDPDILGVIAASLALGTSPIPWGGPVSSVRINRKQTGEWEVNPTYVEREQKDFDLDLIACGRDGQINMIELAGHESDERNIVEALNRASVVIEQLQTWQSMIVKEIGKPKFRVVLPDTPATVKELFASEIAGQLDTYVFSGQPGHAKIEALAELWQIKAKEKLAQSDLSFVRPYFDEMVNAILHSEAIANERRADGRKLNELRPLYAQAGGVSPVLHGSGIFYRGGTHIFSILTLGGPNDAQIIDNMEHAEHKRFMHHYNFPPYSTGETGKVGSTNRRMIGHGALAEKALEPMIPTKEAFPYTIRLVSEAFSSNGSTSMGSVCGASLALMDGGVPIVRPVAGIASGLMMESPTHYKILTDIQGPEDHHGDMDFKVAGTTEGVTAIQMDVKVSGVPIPILAEAFSAARKARLEILKVMAAAIAGPRATITKSAPEIILIKIKPEKIGLVIGGGGKTIKDIKEKSGVEDIQIEDDGAVYITGKNGSASLAQKIILDLTHEYKVGEKFTGAVTRIMDFGVFVRIAADTEGLVHVSELASFRVDKPSSLVKIGDSVPVVVKEVDEKGRLNLSIKLAAPDFFKAPTLTPPIKPIAPQA